MSKNPTSYSISPYFVVLGVCGGLLGSLFIKINSEINTIRRIYLTTPWKKVVETLIFTTFTAALIFSAPLIT